MFMTHDAGSSSEPDQPSDPVAEPTVNRAKLRDLLARQDGIVTLRQTRACGLHRSAVARKCASSEWERIGPSVYRATDHLLTAQARIRAAVWSAGSTAVLCGPAAAYWRGLWPREPKSIDLTVGRSRSTRKPFSPKLGPVRLLHRDLRDVDRTTVRNLSTTSPALTVLDALPHVGMDLLDRTLQSGAVDLADLIAAAARYPRRRSADAVAEMLERAASGARSAAERHALVQLLRSSELPPFELNYQAVGEYEVDVAFVAQRVAVEIDGMAYHSDAQAFQHDRTRGNALTAAGWTVVHFTWADIVERPQQTLAMIRWHLAAADRRIAAAG